MSHEKKKPGAVLLFSGGLDSYLVHRLWQPEHLLFIACGHRYEKREIQAICDLGDDVRSRLHYNYSLNLGGWEREDAIIPLRNLLFAAVASRYADTVWMGGLAGEVNWDKTPEFYWTASAALSHCYRPSYWCEGRVVHVTSPAAHLTKAELLKLALEKGVTREEVANTVSCYEKEGFCGECSSCFKRAVATKLNGWVEDYAWPPFESLVAFRAIVKAHQGEYPERRCTEVLQATSARNLAYYIDRLRQAGGKA